MLHGDQTAVAVQHPETKLDSDPLATQDQGHYCLGRLHGFAIGSARRLASEPMRTTEIEIR